MSALIRAALGRAALGIVVGVTCGAGLAAAQDVESRDGYERQTERQIRELLANPDSDGQRVTLIYQKFDEMFQGRLKLRKRDNAQVLTELFVLDRELRRNLESNLDSDGQRLRPRRSNVQLFGTIRNGRDGMRVVVDRVHLLRSDLETYSGAAENLPEDDPDRPERLADAIRSRLQVYEHDAEESQALTALAQRLDERARDIRRAGLGQLPDAAEQWLTFGQRYEDLQILRDVQEHPDVSAEVRQRAEQILARDLNAQYYLGSWWSYRRFKNTLGFVQHPDDADAWILTERAEFLRVREEAIQRLRDREQLIPSILGLQEEAAIEGQLVKGQTKQHVQIAAQNRGLARYPVYVDRIRGRTYVWEQWVLEDDTRIYFLQGQVFQIDAPPTEDASPDQVGGE